MTQIGSLESPVDVAGRGGGSTTQSLLALFLFFPSVLAFGVKVP